MCIFVLLFLSVSVCAFFSQLCISWMTGDISTKLIAVTHYQLHVTPMRLSTGSRAKVCCRNLVNSTPPEPLKWFVPKLTQIFLMVSPRTGWVCKIMGSEVKDTEKFFQRYCSNVQFSYWSAVCRRLLSSLYVLVTITSLFVSWIFVCFFFVKICICVFGFGCCEFSSQFGRQYQCNVKNTSL